MDAPISSPGSSSGSGKKKKGGAGYGNLGHLNFINKSSKQKLSTSDGSYKKDLIISGINITSSSSSYQYHESYPSIRNLYWGNLISLIACFPLIIYYIYRADTVLFHNYKAIDDSEATSLTFLFSNIVATTFIMIGLSIVTRYSTPSRIFAGLYYQGNPNQKPPEEFFARHTSTGYLMGASIMTLSFVPYLMAGIFLLVEKQIFRGCMYVIGSLGYLIGMIVCQLAFYPPYMAADPEDGIFGRFIATRGGRCLLCARSGGEDRCWSEEWLIQSLGSDLMFSTTVGAILFMVWTVQTIVWLFYCPNSLEAWANACSICIFCASSHYYILCMASLDDELDRLSSVLFSSKIEASENTKLLSFTDPI